MLKYEGSYQVLLEILYGEFLWEMIEKRIPVSMEQ